MARTPLITSLQRAFRLAALAERRGPRTPPLDELVETAYSRRHFLRQSAAASAAAVAVSCRAPSAPAPSSGGTPPAPAAPQPAGAPRIAIVGAGVAGLNAAYKLQKAGLTAKVFEGANRTGGRMFTATDLLGAGLTTELGGEFIDSSHEEMLALMTEFNLERVDTAGPGTEKLVAETYFVNGRHYTQAQAAAAFVPLAKKIAADYDSMGEIVNYEIEGGGSAFDKQSIDEYLTAIGCTGWMREMLASAYVTEYGLELGEQSACRGCPGGCGRSRRSRSTGCRRQSSANRCSVSWPYVSVRYEPPAEAARPADPSRTGRARSRAPRGQSVASAQRRAGARTG